jgi:hypothetical protein
MVTAARKLFAGSPRKFIAGVTGFFLFILRTLATVKGQNTTVLDQTLIATLGVFFAPDMTRNSKELKGVDNEKA